MAIRTPQIKTPLSPLEYHEAEGFPEAPATVREPRRTQAGLTVGIGLVALVAILAALTAAFALAAARAGDTDDGREGALRRAAPAAPGQGADAGRRQGRRRSRSSSESIPTLPAVPAGAVKKFTRRRPPARDAGPPGPRADRGVDATPSTARPTAAPRASPPIVVNQGDKVADHLRQRRLEGDGRQHAALDRLPLRRGRPEQELHRRRPGKKLTIKLRRRAPRRVHVPLRDAAGPACTRARA